MGQERGLFGTRCTFWHTPAATAPSKTCALRYAPLAVSWKPHVPPTKHSSSTHPVAAMRRPRVQKPVCLIRSVYCFFLDSSKLVPKPYVCKMGVEGTHP